MRNNARFTRGRGPIGFERLGPWRTDATDQAGLGAPLVYTASGKFRSKYGELYKISGQAGGGNGNAGTAGSCCTPSSPGGAGGSGAAFVLWWVGTGEVIDATVGGIGGTTSFGALATATGGGNGISGTAGGGGAATGQAQLLMPGAAGGVGAAAAGLGLASAPTPSALGLSYGRGGNGGFGGAGGIAGQPGVMIIERVLPVMNSLESSFSPVGGTL